MRRFLSYAFTILLVTLCWPLAARADYFVWQDAGTGMSLTFPDTWQRANNIDADDIVTLLAPSGRENAMCRVRMRPEGRFLIYPPGFASDIQKTTYNADFWMDYLTEYFYPQLYIAQDTAGLGRAFAGYAEASYWSTRPGPMMPRHGLMFAALYNGRAYVLECSSHADAFDRWKAAFLSVAKSVDFPKAYHELVQGNYPRNFTGDSRMIFRSPDNDAATTY